MGLRGTNSGPAVPIVSIAAGSAAAEHRLAVNDVALAVNGQVVDTYVDVQKM